MINRKRIDYQKLYSDTLRKFFELAAHSYLFINSFREVIRAKVIKAVTIFFEKFTLVRSL